MLKYFLDYGPTISYRNLCKVLRPQMNIETPTHYPEKGLQRHVQRDICAAPHVKHFAPKSIWKAPTPTDTR